VVGNATWIAANYRDQYMNKNTARSVGIIVFLLAVAGGGYWFYYNSSDRVLARAIESGERLKRDLDRQQGLTQQPSQPSVAPTASETNTPDQPKPAPIVDPEESTWKFHEKTDSFTNRKIQFATLKSLNTLELPFPYQGPQHAYLRVYPMSISDGSVQYSIALMLEHGQFLCRPQPYSHACTLNFKYDNQLFTQWGARRSSDDSTSILELGSYPYINVNGPGCLAVQLEWYKSLAIQAEFFQAGLRTMEFNIEGLDMLPLQHPTQKQLKECRGYKLREAAAKP
jgi:hypothetical protein